MNSIQKLRETVSDHELQLRAELAKRGVNFDKDCKSKSEHLTAWGELRRLVNEIRNETVEIIDKMEKDPKNQTLRNEYDEKIGLIKSLGAMVEIHSHYLDLMEIGDAHQRGDGRAFGGGDNWSGRNGSIIQILGKNDRFSSLVDRRTEGRGFGFGQFVAAMVRGTDSPEIRNALSEGTDSAGGYTVPRHLMAEIIDRMRSKTTVIQAGALTVPLEGQTTTIARLSSDPAAGWRVENALVAESDPTFEAVTFTARSLAVLVKVSRELLDDSVNIDVALASAFAGAMAVEADRVALFGSGTAPEPRGVFNTANVNSVSMGTNGAQIANYGKLLDCIYELKADNAADPTAQIMNPRTWRTIQGFADTTGQPLQPPPALSSLPQLVSTTVPVNQVQGSSGAVCSPIIVGDFSQLFIGVRQELRIEVLRERFADNLQYGFLAHMRMDVAVAHPESFCKLVGILP